MPTSSDPARPGPYVTAIASTSRHRDPGARERLVEDRDDPAEVGPRRDLRDDSARRGVERGLARDDVGVDPPAAFDERDPGLVARRFDRRGSAGRSRVRLRRVVIGRASASVGARRTDRPAPAPRRAPSRSRAIRAAERRVAERLRRHDQGVLAVVAVVARPEPDRAGSRTSRTAGAPRCSTGGPRASPRARGGRSRGRGTRGAAARRSAGAARPGWTANVVMWASSTISHIPPNAMIRPPSPDDEVVREPVRLELAAVGVRRPRRAEARQLDLVDLVEVLEAHRLDAQPQRWSRDHATSPVDARTPRGNVTYSGTRRARSSTSPASDPGGTDADERGAEAGAGPLAARDRVRRGPGPARSTATRTSSAASSGSVPPGSSRASWPRTDERPDRTDRRAGGGRRPSRRRPRRPPRRPRPRPRRSAPRRSRHRRSADRARGPGPSPSRSRPAAR